MIIEWKEGFAIGIEEIDEQHKDLIGTVNDLYDAFFQNKSGEMLSVIFDQLISYAHFHFATEEKYFEEFGYEGAAEHKKDHEKFKTELNQFKARVGEKDREKLAFEILSFLESWLETHVKEMDQKYVACFKEHGLK